MQRRKVNKDGESYKNGKFGENRKSDKNLPWVWQIFKLDAKSDPWSGDFDENGKYSENSSKP